MEKIMGDLKLHILEVEVRREGQEAYRMLILVMLTEHGEKVLGEAVREEDTLCSLSDA